MSGMEAAGKAAAGFRQERRSIRGEAPKLGCVRCFELFECFPCIVQRVVPRAASAAEEVSLLVREYAGQIVIGTDVVENIHFFSLACYLIFLSGAPSGRSEGPVE